MSVESVSELNECRVLCNKLIQKIELDREEMKSICKGEVYEAYDKTCCTSAENAVNRIQRKISILYNAERESI